MGVGEIRSQPQRLPDHFGRSRQVAATQRDDAKQMNGRGIIRREPQRLPIVRFCLIYPANTVQRHALLQGLHRLRPPGPQFDCWLGHYVLEKRALPHNERLILRPSCGGGSRLMC